MPPLNILVVEDEPDIAELLVHMLAKEGYCVQHASDGITALAILRSGQTDLIITDIMMPRMSGVDLIQAVQATPEMHQIPIVVLTALPKAHVESRCQAVSVFLQKPFRGRDLIAIVGSLLASRLRLPASPDM